MAVLEPIPLKRFFNLFAPTHVLGTTYSLSLAFFESVVLPLFRERLEGCVLLTDRLGFSRAVQEAGALLEATRSYCVAPAPSQAAFHSKVWVLVNEERACLLVGSGNLTQSGMVDNLEAFEVVELVGCNAIPGISAQVLTFLSGLEELWSREQRGALPALRILAALRHKLEQTVGTASTTSNSDTFFMSSFGGAFPEQWKARVGQVVEVHVASPYFAASTRGLELLGKHLGVQRLFVHPAKHPDGGIDLPLEKAAALPGAEIRELPWASEGKRFAHLKLFGLLGSDGSHWIFTGSVNATGDALSGRNIEAGLLRRIDSKTWRGLWPEGEMLSDTPLAALNHEGRGNARGMLFHVTDLGESFDLLITESARNILPLCDVELVWLSGVSRRVAKCKTLFTAGPVSRIQHAVFSEAKDGTGRCGLLRLTARAANGEAVEGAAFVDDVESLLSSPLQRRAFGCALDLVDSEGLPDWTGVTSFLELIEETLTDNSEEIETSAATGGSASADPAVKPEPEPLWPPRAAEVELISPILHRKSRSVAWLDRIRLLLVARERDDTPIQRPGQETEDASDEELRASGEVDESPAKAKRARTDAEKYWAFATGWLDQWVEREKNAQLDTRLASRLLPASFVLTRWILRLRRKLRRAAQDLDWPPPPELARAFLRRMFDERPRDDEYRPTVERYSMSASPPLLPDAAEFCGWRPTESDQVLVVALFGLLQTRSQMKEGTRFPAFWWLLWQRICPVDEEWIKAHFSAVNGFLRHTMLDDDEVLPANVLESALRDLLNLKWENHPGYNQIRHLQAVVRIDDAGTVDSRDLGTFRALVKRDGSANIFHRAKAGTRSCPNRRCRAIGMEQPEIRDSLKRQLPVICPLCNNVAVPSLLYDVCAPF